MNGWSEIEVEVIIADYFDMLSKELSGVAYRKAEHRRKIMPLLKNRSEGSIEFKHQNISAVLVHLGQPYIVGYLPRYNYQKILEHKVIDFLTDNRSIEIQFRKFAENTGVHQISLPDFRKFLVDPPGKGNILEEPAAAYLKNPIKTNYLEKEQQNKDLGILGEELVLDYEKWRLTISGKNNFADQVRWISKEDGDGAGFDILSRNPNGTDKYIEVKTTKLGKETPFFFSRNEFLFSQTNKHNYHLYRLFNFDKEAKMFIKNGGLDTICNSVPITFKGSF